MSQFQITFNFPTSADAKTIAAQLRMQAGLLEGMPAKEASSRKNTDAPTDEIEKPVMKARAKAKVAKPDDDEEFELPEYIEEEIEENEIEEESEITKEDILKACQIHKKKNGGDPEKTVAIIKKFAKSALLKDVTPDQYPKLLKALGA